MSYSLLQRRLGKPPSAYRVYLFSDWQCRTSSIRMYMSQLAYKTVAFALILDRGRATLRVVAGFIKRIFQNRRLWVSVQGPQPARPSTLCHPRRHPHVTVNLFTPSGADTVSYEREHTWPRTEGGPATLKANNVKFLRTEPISSVHASLNFTRRV